MTNTTKYILFGGAALVATLVIVNRVQAKKTEATKATGLMGVIGGVTTIATNLKGLSLSGATAPKLSTDPTTTAAAPRVASTADASGLRSLPDYVLANSLHMTSAEATLASYG